MSEKSGYLDKVIDMLVDCSMFNNFSPTELQQVAPYFTITDVPEDSVIFNEGDMAQFMGIIHTGKIAVLKSDSSNNPVELAVLKKDKTFGEMAVLDGERRSATCTAVTECSLLTLSKTSLDKMLEEHPKVGAKVIRAIAVSLSKRLRIVDFKLADHQL